MTLTAAQTAQLRRYLPTVARGKNIWLVLDLRSARALRRAGLVTDKVETYQVMVDRDFGRDWICKTIRQQEWSLTPAGIALVSSWLDA
jgi:hypothetical protein